MQPQLGRDSASSRTCCPMQLRAATNRYQLCSSHQTKGSIKCETGRWEAVVTNDSIGKCFSGSYMYILKFPEPPRAVLLVTKTDSIVCLFLFLPCLHCASKHGYIPNGPECAPSSFLFTCRFFLAGCGEPRDCFRSLCWTSLSLFIILVNNSFSSFQLV